jgi:hypothetical protein
MYPTLIKLAGGKLEQKLPIDGKDAWPTITAGKPTPHADILLNTTPAGGAIRAGYWKLVVADGADDPDGAQPKKKKNKKDGPSVELFDLKADPFEKENLFEKNPDVVKDLRARLAAYAKQAVPPKAKPRPADFVAPKVWGEKD